MKQRKTDWENGMSASHTKEEGGRKKARQLRDVALQVSLRGKVSSCCQPSCSAQPLKSRTVPSVQLKWTEGFYSLPC